MKTAMKTQFETLQAPLQYLKSTSSAPAQYHASKAGNANEAVHDGDYETRTVPIHDARLQGNWSLDRQGFRLLTDRQPEGLDFHDDDQLKKIYDEHVQQLILKHAFPEAKQVYVFDHTRRSSSSSTRQEKIMREPSSVIHNDYTAWSANKRIREILGEDALTNSKGRRFAIVNVWRPINGTVEDWPMCFCDSNTVDAQNDLVSVPRVSNDGRKGEIHMAHYNSRHRWYFFPDMTTDEVLVFKTFDSVEAEGFNQYTIHTAFDLAAAYGDKETTNRRPRESLETRTFVLF